ncbi:MAG: hypothetical protein ACREB9_07585 [Thermoplasmata archaeon]
MPVDTHLAAVHYRVQQAGQALEYAITFLNGRRMFQGIVQIRQAVSHLQHAQSYLLESGQYPDLLAYVGTLVAFYNGEIGKVVRPTNAPAVGAGLYGNQANLLAADPVLFPSVAH